MPTTTLRPSGDGTVTGWSGQPSGTLAAATDDDPDSNDGDTTYALSPNLSDSNAFLLLDDVPGDFNPAGITSITIKAAVKFFNVPFAPNDVIDLYLRLYRSDETTVITDESTVCNITDTGSYVVFSRTVAVSGSHSVADWNGARLRLRQDYTVAGAPDSTARMRITAVEVEVTYSLLGDVFVDSWLPPLQMPVLPLRRTTAPFGLLLIDPGLAAPAPELSWFARTSEPVRTVPQPPRTPGVLAIDPSTFPPPETITLDKWWRPLSEPVRTVPQPPRVGGAWQYDPATFSFVEDIFVDKWFSMGLLDLPRVAPRAQPTVLSQVIEPGSITVPRLGWDRSPDPVRRVPRAQPTTGAYQFEVGQLPAIWMQWFSQTSTPVLRPPRAQATEWDYPFVPLLVAARMDWYQTPQVPARRQISAKGLDAIYPIEPGQVANLALQWLVLPCEPVRRVPRAQPTSGQVPLEPSLLVTPPLGWLTEPPELPRARRRAQPTTGLQTSHEQFEPSTFDVCVQMQPPVRHVRRALPTTGESHVDPSLFIVPSVTTWYTLPQVPVRPQSKHAALIAAELWQTLGPLEPLIVHVGLEYTAPHELLHYTCFVIDLEFTAPEHLLHYTTPDEDDWT